MGSILYFTFSPDGQFLAACDSSYQIKIWEVATNQEVAMLLGHQGWVWHLQFSHNGKYLVSGSSDRTMRIWDLTTYNCVKILTGNQDWVWRVAFSLNSKLAISIGADRYIRIWWWQTGRNLLTFRVPDVQTRDGAFDARRGLLAVCSTEGLKIWRVWMASCIQQIGSKAAKSLRSVSFTPDGRMIVGADFNCDIHGWDLETGEERWVLRGHPTQIFHISYDNEGQIISSCLEQVRLWNLETGHCVQTISIARDKGKGLIYRAPLLVTGSDNGVVKFWNLETAKCLQTSQGNAARVMELATSRQHTTVATTKDDGTLHLWDFSGSWVSGEMPPARVYSAHEGMSTAIAFSPDGHLLASTGSDRLIHIWDVNRGQVVQTLHGHTDGFAQVRFINNELLFSHSDDGTGRQWDIQTGNYEIVTYPQQQWCMVVDCSPCGRYIAMGSIVAVVTVLDRQTGEKQNYSAVGNRLRQMIYSADGYLLLGITDNGYLNCWDLRQNYHHTHFFVDNLQTTSLVSHPLHLGWLIVATEDGAISVWDVMNQVCVQRVNEPLPNVPRQHDRAISSVRTIPQPERLISCAVDGEIKVWLFASEGLVLDRVLAFPRPYEGMKIGGARGLNQSQRNTLLRLGATVVQ